MKNKIKDKVLEFLKKNKEKKFSMSEISRRINVSYPPVLKAIDVLHAEKRIKIEDHGNIKLVCFLEEKDATIN